MSGIKTAISVTRVRFPPTTNSPEADIMLQRSMLTFKETSTGSPGPISVLTDLS